MCVFLFFQVRNAAIGPSNQRTALSGATLRRNGNAAWSRSKMHRGASNVGSGIGRASSLGRSASRSWTLETTWRSAARGRAFPLLREVPFFAAPTSASATDWSAGTGGRGSSGSPVSSWTVTLTPPAKCCCVFRGLEPAFGRKARGLPYSLVEKPSPSGDGVFTGKRPHSRALTRVGNSGLC